MKNLKLRTTKCYVIAVCLGAAVGCLTLLGQKYLPINLNFLANSVSCWLVPPFLLVFFAKPDKKNAVGINVACLLSCVLAYYSFEALYNHHSFAFSSFVFLWLISGVVGGVVFGLGACFANGRDRWLKYIGLDLLPAVFLSDGINKLIHIQYYLHMIPAVILIILIGIVLYFITNHKASLKKKNIYFLILLTVLGIIGFEILFKITI